MNKGKFETNFTPKEKLKNLKDLNIDRSIFEDVVMYFIDEYQEKKTSYMKNIVDLVDDISLNDSIDFDQNKDMVRDIINYELTQMIKSKSGYKDSGVSEDILDDVIEVEEGNKNITTDIIVENIENIIQGRINECIEYDMSEDVLEDIIAQVIQDGGEGILEEVGLESKSKVYYPINTHHVTSQQDIAIKSKNSLTSIEDDIAKNNKHNNYLNSIQNQYNKDMIQRAKVKKTMSDLLSEKRVNAQGNYNGR